MSTWLLFLHSGMLGALAGGPLTKQYGPRKTQVYNNVTFISGGILLAMARNIPMLCLGRLLVYDAKARTMTLPQQWQM